jgi:hypothetical protein
MPRGSKPGKRSDGRANGAPNRSTLELERGLANAVGADAYAGKLGKDTMAWAMGEFRALAMRYHPGGNEPDEARFVRYLRLAADTGRDLAPYQSAKLAQTTICVDQENRPSEACTAEQLREEILDDMEKFGLLPAFFEAARRGGAPGSDAPLGNKNAHLSMAAVLQMLRADINDLAATHVPHNTRRPGRKMFQIDLTTGLPIAAVLGWQPRRPAVGVIIFDH